jgi:uncharacterized protein (DUF1499 family)
MTALKTFAIRLVIVIGIVVAGTTALMAILARVVKSPANLGVREGRLAPCPNSPNCVSTQSQDPRHQIAPIPYTTSPEKAKAALIEIIRAMEGTQIITDDLAYVHAEFRTPGFGYVDDVEFFVDQEAQVIHFRSSARLPYYDFEVNRKRMEAVRAAFEATLGGAG